ncbi:hypothetical protein [Aeromonas sobria]|jgi:hypothetical protein|uniref:hypothetical protein n=1 Tax=Aeromonas sobria TaxID=646 RepID=UPI0026EDD195|nr:hypothetical protein [Aeromonas sobria]
MNSSERFEVLKIELQLIQATLDKYDDLIFRSRNFFMTIWMASVGLAFTIKTVEIFYLASLFSVICWFLEGMIRFKYWIKYVDRYRYLRDSINSSTFNISLINIYDLTNHFHRENKIPVLKRINVCFVKMEPVILYFTMAASSLLLAYMIKNGVISFQVK